jgi:molecular chaperone GrpE
MHNENPTPGASAPEDDYGLDNELEQLRAAMASLREEALRERAELDNQRKRLARDVDQARRFANEKLLSQLLPVLDSLDAGLAAAGAETGPLKDGLELTLRQLLKVGEDNGLAQLDPIGQAFDPEWHQAISQVASPGKAAGTVVQVFQKGYALNDRLLRPALVVVAAE